MKRLVLALLLGAVPGLAQASGGLACRTAGSGPIEIALGFGHVAGSPLISARLTDSKRPVPVRSAQWWLDGRDLRLVLTDPAALRLEAVLKASRKGRGYDGSLWRRGVRKWVRCREDG